MNANVIHSIQFTIDDIKTRILPTVSKITEQDTKEMVAVYISDILGGLKGSTINSTTLITLHSLSAVAAVIPNTKHLKITNPTAFYTEVLEELILNLEGTIKSIQDEETNECNTCNLKEECIKEESLEEKGQWPSTSVH